MQNLRFPRLRFARGTVSLDLAMSILRGILKICFVHFVALIIALSTYCRRYLDEPRNQIKLVKLNLQPYLFGKTHI